MLTKGPLKSTGRQLFCLRRRKAEVRTFSKNDGELIYYRRSDQQAAKESFYLPLADLVA